MSQLIRFWYLSQKLSHSLNMHAQLSSGPTLCVGAVKALVRLCIYPFLLNQNLVSRLKYE